MSRKETKFLSPTKPKGKKIQEFYLWSTVCQHSKHAQSKTSKPWKVQNPAKPFFF